MPSKAALKSGTASKESLLLAAPKDSVTQSFERILLHEVVCGLWVLIASESSDIQYKHLVYLNKAQRQYPSWDASEADGHEADLEDFFHNWKMQVISTELEEAASSKDATRLLCLINNRSVRFYYMHLPKLRQILKGLRSYDGSKKTKTALQINLEDLVERALEVA